jgi:hypothetical protein
MTNRSKPALHGVASHRTTHRLGDDETESRRRGGNSEHVIAAKDVQHGVPCWNATAAAHGGAEVIRPRNPVRPGQQRLSGEFGATLATTSRQDGATGAGAHAQPESVHLGTTTVVRLEGSLAHGDSSKAQLCGPERCSAVSASQGGGKSTA